MFCMPLLIFRVSAYCFELVKDPNIIVGMEASIKNAEFASPEEVAQALLAMDGRAITPDRLGNYVSTGRGHHRGIGRAI